jgi:phosphoribosylformylglycinamidine (FGAM) synthase-like enzyme
MGCTVILGDDQRVDLALFGEGPSRIIASLEAERVPAFEKLMAEWAVPWRWIGETGGTRMVTRMGQRTVVDADLERLETAWRNGFERHLA